MQRGVAPLPRARSIRAPLATTFLQSTSLHPGTNISAIQFDAFPLLSLAVLESRRWNFPHWQRFFSCELYFGTLARAAVCLLARLTAPSFLPCLLPMLHPEETAKTVNRPARMPNKKGRENRGSILPLDDFLFQRGISFPDSLKPLLKDFLPVAGLLSWPGLGCERNARLDFHGCNKLGLSGLCLACGQLKQVAGPSVGAKILSVVRLVAVVPKNRQPVFLAALDVGKIQDKVCAFAPCPVVKSSRPSAVRTAVFVLIGIEEVAQSVNHGFGFKAFELRRLVRKQRFA